MRWIKTIKHDVRIGGEERRLGYTTQYPYFASLALIGAGKVEFCDEPEVERDAVGDEPKADEVDATTSEIVERATNGVEPTDSEAAASDDEAADSVEGDEVVEGDEPSETADTSDEMTIVDQVNALPWSGKGDEVSIRTVVAEIEALSGDKFEGSKLSEHREYLHNHLSSFELWLNAQE